MNTMHRERVSALLPLVSRTFALSIRVLKQPLRGRIARAYLLCRLLDTFEDDPELSVHEKKEALSSIIHFLEGGPLPELALYIDAMKASQAEIDLVREAGALLLSLKEMPEQAAGTIRKWAAVMGRGMILFLEKNEIQTVEELEEYCYYVAGTVGLMLTALFKQHCRLSSLRSAILDKYAVNFGLCLQFVNILKDSGPDFQEGRCFIPSSLIEEQGLTRDSFFKSGNRVAASIVYGKLLQKADAFVHDSETYIRALSGRHYKVRRFCILPLLLAKKTLKLLHTVKGDLPSATSIPKISRSDIKRSLLASYPASFSNAFFRLL